MTASRQLSCCLPLRRGAYLRTLEGPDLPRPTQSLSPWIVTVQWVGHRGWDQAVHFPCPATNVPHHALDGAPHGDLLVDKADGPALLGQALQPHDPGGILSLSPWATWPWASLCPPEPPFLVCKVGFLVVGPSWDAGRIEQSHLCKALCRNGAQNTLFWLTSS